MSLSQTALDAADRMFESCELHLPRDANRLKWMVCVAGHIQFAINVETEEIKAKYEASLEALREAELHAGILNARIEKLKEELSILKTDLAAAINALRALYDWQNGPPLLTAKWECGWGDAKKLAEIILDKCEEKTSKAIPKPNL